MRDHSEIVKCSKVEEGVKRQALAAYSVVPTADYVLLTAHGSPLTT